MPQDHPAPRRSQARGGSLPGGRTGTSTDTTHRPPRRTLSRAVALRNEAIQMYGYEYDLACDRLAELRSQADAAGRLRRLRAARRWARRAEYARLRAARASAAVR
ncbi:hypothetical protein [Trujillonella humicola]|uniref:hypothetical protein n=1 Tax=Trujillonella humicola TaxID=3383699 RepID=UPI003906ABE5